MSTPYNPVVYFEIPVNDIDRAIKFYYAVFGFEFEKEVIHNNEMAFFPLKDNDLGISGALAKGEIYKPTKDGTLLYFQTEHIQQTLNLAVQNGAEILFPITSNGEWGCVAEFEDCEGNRIALRSSNTLLDQPIEINTKQPEECKNMVDIRQEIDTIDQQVISLIAKRYQYVKSASKFKTSEASVKAPERFAAMLLERRKWAEMQSLDPDVIEKIYTDLVHYFIAEELKHWKAQE